MSLAGFPANLHFIRRPEIVKEKAIENFLRAGFVYSRSFVTSPEDGLLIEKISPFSIRLDLSRGIPPV